MDDTQKFDYGVGQQTLISCTNSQGEGVQANVMRLNRHFVVFEVYNPYSILQLSEVLSNFRVTVRDKVIYSGRAVVSNIVNAGLLLICEATLQDDWVDFDVIKIALDPKSLEQEFLTFLQEWNKIQQIGNEFKIAVADAQSFLIGLNRWLEQIELGVNTGPSFGFREGDKTLYENLSMVLEPQIEPFFTKFEAIASTVPEDDRFLHRSYAKRQMHPILLCAPFVYRTFSKPLGYAGDYEMVNMMLRDPYEGSSLFAKLLNFFFLQCAPAQAHRNRIRYLIDQLTRECQRCLREGRPAKIFDLGCGPAKEVQEFIGGLELADKAEFTLVDFNDETLRYTKEILDRIKTNNRRITAISYQQKSVHEILRAVSKKGGWKSDEKHDMVYCAGLFDYLSDRVCTRLISYFYELLAPGGLLIVTNVDASNPQKHWMEFILDWHLIYRTRDELVNLLPKEMDKSLANVSADSTGVNIFLEYRKPQAEASATNENRNQKVV